MMRLTIQIGREKLRIPIEPYRTIAYLQAEIIRRWERRHKGEFLAIQELRTSDNVRLDNDDQIIEVCREDEIIIVLVSSGHGEEAQLGDMVQQYYLTELIGEGTYGRVFKAHDLNLNRYVAIKILKKDKQNEINTRRFLREAELNGSLSNNPYVVTVHDFGRTRSGTLFIVMELLKGRPLNELLDERIAAHRPFTALELIQIISPVLKGLHAAHTHTPATTHRDVKPDNIWICNESALTSQNKEPLIAKLMDFGISIHDEITHQTLACGTRMYSSPEQVRKNSKMDGRSDIYSVGVVLYQMATLLVDVPFDPIELNLGAKVPHISQHTKTVLSGNFQAIIMRALELDVKNRFQSAEEMDQALWKEQEAITSGHRNKPANAASAPMASSNAARSLELISSNLSLVQPKSSPNAQSTQPQLQPLSKL